MAIPGPHKRWKYDLHPSVAMAHSVIAGMKEKTGRSLDEWVRHVKKNGPSAERARAAWLKKEHRLGANYASWIAAKSAGASNAFEDANEYLEQAQDYVDKMYDGPKAHLRPIYDAILTFAKTLGKDVGVSPCSTMVPIYRKHVIAQIKPTTRTRIRPGPCAEGHEDAEAVDRHRRPGQERPHHSSHRDNQCRGVRRRGQALDANGVRDGRVSSVQ